MLSLHVSINNGIVSLTWWLSCLLDYGCGQFEVIAVVCLLSKNLEMYPWMQSIKVVTVGRWTESMIVPSCICVSNTDIHS